MLRIFIFFVQQKPCDLFSNTVCHRWLDGRSQGTVWQTETHTHRYTKPHTCTRTHAHARQTPASLRTRTEGHFIIIFFEVMLPSLLQESSRITIRQPVCYSQTLSFYCVSCDLDQQQVVRELYSCESLHSFSFRLSFLIGFYSLNIHHESSLIRKNN